MAPPPPSPFPAPDGSAPAPNVKKSLLAWWGIIPALLFLAVQFTFGWPKDTGRQALEYSVGFVAGGYLFGLVLSLLVAWVSYRLTRRSQLVSTIIFTLVLGLLSLSVAAKPLRQWSARRRMAAAYAVPVMASFADFRFEIPAGWRREQPGGENTKAALVLDGEKPNTVDGLLTVDSGKPAVSTARAMAQSLARKDGQVFPDSISIDGIEGIRVETPSENLSRPHFAVVAFRKGKVYLIMAAEQNGADVSEAFDHVLKTWHWNDRR
jgi:hypothetical protein